jgi:hypothetical protein
MKWRLDDGVNRSDCKHAWKHSRSHGTLPITLKEFVDLKKSSSQDEVARFATNFGCLHYS